MNFKEWYNEQYIPTAEIDYMTSIIEIEMEKAWNASIKDFESDFEKAKRNRREILVKHNLTDDDYAELEILESQYDFLSDYGNQTVEDRKAMDIIRRAASLLKLKSEV